MKRTRGFTLIELLVVIAIISLLAAITLPQVTQYIAKGRRTKALAEIKSLDTAITGMLADVGVSNARQLFNATFWNTAAGLYTDNVANVHEAQLIYSDIFYDLLRNGKNASTTVETATNSYPVANFMRPGVMEKLKGTGYMNLDRDPWENLYQFYPGPIPNRESVPFRIRNVQNSVPGGPIQIDAGYEAPRNLPIYIYSYGENLQPDQPIFDGNYLQEQIDIGFEDGGTGGGDDINNWDNGLSWEEVF